MKIYLIGGTKDFLDRVEESLHSSGQKDTHILVSPNVTPEELQSKAADCEILVASPSGFEKITKEHMQAIPKLKLISTTSVGTDWVDLQAAKELGILVSNEKGVNAEAVAEHCFGLILDVSKRITEADRDIRLKGGAKSSSYMGIELFGKTLGIIGIGDIGQRVARIAHGFSMKVLGVNRTSKKIDGIQLVPLEKLLKESDIIAVTIPLTPETEDLLGEKEFAVMKNGAVLVSISREKIINKEAVMQAVQSGKLVGYGFDADILDSIKKDDPYLNSSKVVITPHSASMTEEADRGYAEYTVENIKAFLAHNPIRIVS